MGLHGANFGLEIRQLLLDIGVFLRHLFVFRDPLITLLLKSLHLALKVTGLDIGLAEPVDG